VTDKRSPNEQMLDAQILWQVLLLRYSLHVRQIIVAYLNGTEDAVASQIRGALAVQPGTRDPGRLAEVERLVQSLEAVRRAAWDQAAQDVGQELLNLSQTELDHQAELYGAWLPSLMKPLWLVAGAGAIAAPFQGRVMQVWLRDAAVDDARRIRTAVYAGVGLGERPDAIARRVVGSARTRGMDGVTQISRNHADTIARSGVVHVSSWVREKFFEANPSTFATEQFVAVLDSHTTLLCLGLNGNRYPVGTGPLPPLHMGCRSTRYAVLPRNVGGPIPEPEVYESWIRKQSRAVQVELMGATRTQRMRAGTFNAAKFTDFGSKQMTLEQVMAAARRLMGERV
jgi:hypothetical protein